MLEGGLPSTVPISDTVVLATFDTPKAFLLSTPPIPYPIIEFCPLLICKFI